MRAIITGGAGFIGSHLCESLVAHGHTVCAVDDLFRGKRRNLEGCLPLDDFNFISGDATDISILERAEEKLGGVDVVYHLAAINGTRWFHERPDLVSRVNIETLQTTLRFASVNGCRIVFTSSPEAFGEQSEMPLREDSSSIFTAAHLHGRHSYGASKYLGEVLLHHAVHEDALDARIVRPFNGYGPRLPGDAYGQVVAIFLDACRREEDIVIHGDGTQTRSFTYIDDLIDGIRLAGELDQGIDGSRLSGRSFNLGSTEEVSISELAGLCSEISGTGVGVSFDDGHPGDSARRTPDPKPAEEALGWTADLPLREGLKRCWSWLVALTQQESN